MSDTLRSETLRADTQTALAEAAPAMLALMRERWDL